MNAILTNDEIAAFEKLGYLHLKGAFPRESALAMQDFMWSELKRLDGIDRLNRSTWTSSRLGLNKTGRHGIYKAVNSPRMHGAIDQLLGPDTWTMSTGRGGFLVTFPEDGDKPWNVTSKHWHWDGDAAPHLDGPKSLRIFTFYSHVVPEGGGTLVVEGSHRLIRSFLHGLPPDHLSQRQKALKRHFSRSHPWLAELTEQAPSSPDSVPRFMEETTIIDDIDVRVVELTGEPGDAVFCHPAIYHTRSRNCRDVPRFMRARGAGRQKSES